jgi:hypothetical protein
MHKVTKDTMKKLLLILSLILITFVAGAQISTPDTLKLSTKELFSESDNLNDVGVLIVLSRFFVP